MNRRHFLRTSGWGTGLLVLSSRRQALGYEANSKLDVAAIGAAGQGRGNIDAVAGGGENIVALCDVDHAYAAETFKRYPGAKVYADYRRMLDGMGRGIDAVIVSTPDHTHAVASVECMRRGKHVFCEKPLTRTVRESRVMREVALAQKVVTQTGNQGSAANALRRAIELTRDGLLGEVREAHVWFDGGNGPMQRPSETPPVPDTLDWDCWLGPAQYRAYHSVYHPGRWRGWRAFGSGIVGDFGCHTANILFHALRLDELWKVPGRGSDRVVLRFEAMASEADLEGYPRSSRTWFEFPARGDLPPVKVWFYAREKPEVDRMLGYPMGGWGDLLVGAKASLYSDCPWNTRFVLLPEKQFVDFRAGLPRELPRSPGHHREWVEAIKGQGRTFSPFEVGGPLTELLQLANLATLVDGPLEYDTVSGRVLNSARADALVHREYRTGWSL